MTEVESQCIRCNAPLTVEPEHGLTLESLCPKCDSLQIHYIFPAYLEEAEASPRSIAVEEGATCFFHETAGAANICDDCGRYLCGHCTLPIPKPANNPEIFPKQVCPTCYAHRLDDEARSPRWDLFVTTYPRYDIMAVFLATVPVALFPLFILTPLTAPVALYLVFRHWRSCRTPLGRFRLNFVGAFLMVFITAFFWIGFVVMAVARLLGGAP